ncbi:DNA-binding transcriptional regulator, GntR family [Singulisphaera sp. GP187]|uniref:GntR family transcriptional regulator n=1 Tax=Singulisphaera sp. GP187 TaxID=1882752 RepID=UPI000925FDBC|nr:GntR family transcriptional regulator [Singulisphaera sp. GP187]SIO62554.1 DNA-binding transcriptional regulator, GntR family [Singulisphaera sp. GP187]
MDQVSLAQRVYEQLHQRLRSGRLRPGTRLVNRTLAAELGTSTIPVREAIGRLVSEGLLDFTPGAGAFVRAPDPNELGELYDVREALEVMAAVQAARFANDHLLGDLQAICARLRQVAAAIPPGQHASRPQFERWLEDEEEFHTRLVAGSHNRWLVKVVKEIRVIAQVFAAQKAAPRLLTHALAEATVRQHDAFLVILAERDMEQATRWMTAHIRSGRDSVLRHLSASDRNPTPTKQDDD